MATDGHPEAFEFLWPRVPEALKANVTTVVVNFAEMQVPSCDLVNASFALPFCEPQHFVARDTWASMQDRTHHTREEVLALLDGFEIEMMLEEEKDDPPDVRNPKHWQLFHVVARKR